MGPFSHDVMPCSPISKGWLKRPRALSRAGGAVVRTPLSLSQLDLRVLCTVNDPRKLRLDYKTNPARTYCPVRQRSAGRRIPRYGPMEICPEQRNLPGK